MADLVSVKVGKTQKIQNVQVEVADKGGIIVSWTLYTPTKQYSESSYAEHKVVFDDCETALEQIKLLYKTNLSAQIECE